MLTLSAGVTAWGFGSAQSSPVPFATFPVSSHVESRWISTLAFVSDTSLATALCDAVAKTCDVKLFRIGTSDMETIREQRTDLGAILHRYGNGLLLTNYFRLDNTLFSTDLREKTTYDYAPRRISQSGHTAGLPNPDDTIDIYRIPEMTLLRKIPKGDLLLSLSDDTVIILRQREVMVERLLEHETKTFQVDPPRKCWLYIEILTHDRFFMSDCHGHRMIDSNGHSLHKVDLPSGWVTSYGITNDGSRLLFDIRTRKVSRMQRIGEYTVTILSMGIGAADEEDNAEAVRVIDTRDGQPCFDWAQTFNYLMHGEYRADISPSGDLVAILTRDQLSVFKLPAKCGTQR